MTHAVSDEILTRESTNPDDGNVKRNCIFRIDPHATFVAPDEDENPKFDMPWHVATLIKEWAQCIVPLHFYILW